jgi:hypothetical protein
MHNLNRGKKSSVILQKMTKVNNLQFGENSHNLVTPIAGEVKVFSL